jgi:hypothetical protein
MTEPRICAYRPCSVEFTSSHPKARYHDPRCKAADWKVRHDYGARRTVRTDASRPGGAQVGYLKAIDPVTDAVLDYLYEETNDPGWDRAQLRRAVEAGMQTALPARQRERLERGS